MWWGLGLMLEEELEGEWGSMRRRLAPLSADEELQDESMPLAVGSER